MEPRPTDLAVRDASHTGRFEVTHGGSDRVVFDGSKLESRDASRGGLFTCGVHRRRAQQAANMIGAKRWVGFAHGGLLSFETSPKLMHQGDSRS